MIVRKPFFYVRHGQTDYNLRKRYQGGLDIPLNVTGIRQAFSAREALRGQDFTRIYTSPLSRARQTAEIVNEEMALPVTVVPDLQEMNFGDLEGTRVTSEHLREDWLAGIFIPPDGESYDGFTSRVLTGLNRVLEQEGTPLIVAHGGVFWPIAAMLDLPMDTLPNAEPVLVRPTESGWTLDIL